MEEIIKSEFKRRMEEECLARIIQCLTTLSSETIWYAPNSNVNSVGNLVLHLSGNIHQYIQSTLGNENDTRQRDLEFSSHKTHSKEQLIERISTTIKESVSIVNKLESKYFLKDFDVQCFQEKGLNILIHVIEHTSYHTGQITQMTKWICDVDTQYYKDLELNKIN